MNASTPFNVKPFPLPTPSDDPVPSSTLCTPFHGLQDLHPITPETPLPIITTEATPTSFILATKSDFTINPAPLSLESGGSAAEFEEYLSFMDDDASVESSTADAEAQTDIDAITLATTRISTYRDGASEVGPCEDEKIIHLLLGKYAKVTAERPDGEILGCSDVSAELGAAKEEVSGLRAELVEVKGKYNTAQEELETLLMGMNNIQTMMVNAMNEKAAALESCNIMTTEKNALETALKKEMNEKKEAEDKILAMQVKIDEMRMEVSKVEQKGQERKKQLKQAWRVAREAKRRMEESEREVQGWRSKFVEIEVRPKLNGMVVGKAKEK